MIIFRDKPKFKKSLLAIFALSLFLISDPSFAQDRHDTDRPPDEGAGEETQAQQSARDQGVERRFLPSERVPVIERDQATGEPRPILPGPYVPPGTISANAAIPEPLGADDLGGSPGGDDIAISEIDVDEGDIEAREGDPFIVDELGELDLLDPATIGLLTPGTGGLRADVWDGTGRQKIESLFALLPVATRSPAVNEIAMRVLLSATSLPLPAGAARLAGRDVEPAEFVDMGLLEVRLEKLAKSGNLSALLAMLDQLPGEIMTPVIQRLLVDAYLLDGDMAGACAASYNARSGDGAAIWLQVLSFCQALGGDQTGVSFSLSLLEETGEAPGYFVRLIREVLELALSEDDGDARSLASAPDMPTEELNALTLALLRTVGREVPFNVLDGAPPMVLRATVERADLPLDLRADVAEAGVVRGAIEGEVLANIFESMIFTDGERESVNILAESEPSSRIDGLIYSMAAHGSVPQEQARLVTMGWNRAGRQNLRSAIAPVLVRVVETITPSEELIAFAETAGRISLFARRTELAGAWYAEARTLAAAADLEATKALVNLWPLMIAGGPDNGIPYSENILNLWRQSLAGLPGDEQYGRMGFFLGILEALGYEVPAAFWDESLKAPVVDSGRAPSAPLWRQMLVASNEGKRGETLLLSLVAVGEDGFANYSNSALTSMIRALIDTGFEQEARALAVEALIETGF